MAFDYCHPTAPHKKLRLPNWYVSSLMMDRALDAVARKVKTLDRKHDIPYLAGYSKDGKTIYIDRHMPREWEYKGRKINTDRFLLLHEEVEKSLIDQLDLHYLHAHQIATRAEEAAVRAAGISWRDYDRFMQKYVKTMDDERLTKVPADPLLNPTATNTIPICWSAWRLVSRRAFTPQASTRPNCTPRSRANLRRS
ncbi:hypothetical protein [Mesorhizobium huakuii]|uniref:Uncharacterized protein n=1 Tax=Mesorhizobium huakuii TaxID=28104 RepID=A0ABZ0W0N2_9HYPH|nr:hypothetical protein [Mesorhizobium huakuii]WQC02085.1 hypothetical protein U0R22_006326 [Mesorhizobium huakuii]